MLAQCKFMFHPGKSFQSERLGKTIKTAEQALEKARQWTFG